MRTEAGALTVANARVESWTSPEEGVQAWSSRTSVTLEGRQAIVLPTTYSWTTQLQVVGILAFIQSLLFLVIWLWICASVGAGAPPKVEFSPELLQSRYDPVKQRDPFSKSGAIAKDTTDSKPVPAPTYAFHLDGILYQPRDPSAIVDGTLLSLNKTVTLNAGNGKVQVKAVEITRDHVVLEIGGRTIELRVNMQESAAPLP